MMPRYPRVTQILAATGLTVDFSTIDQLVLAAAQERGSAVHEAILSEHYGFDFDLAPEWAPYMDAYRKFAAETSHVPLVSEYEVVSRRWKVIGHLDRMGLLTLERFTGHRVLIDFKTGGAQGVEVQLAAYVSLYNEMHPKEPVTRAAAVALRRDGTYRIHAVDVKAPMAHGFTPTQVWHAAVTLWWARDAR